MSRKRRGGGEPRSFMSELQRGTRMAPIGGFNPRAVPIAPAPVADLTAERLRRVEGAGQAAHERGEAFAIAHYVFDDMIGHDVTGEDRALEVIVVIDGALSALGMSARDAIRLGEALIVAGKGAPSMNPKPPEPDAG